MSAVRVVTPDCKDLKEHDTITFHCSVDVDRHIAYSPELGGIIRPDASLFMARQRHGHGLSMCCFVPQGHHARAVTIFSLTTPPLELEVRSQHRG
jgi:hypothetical protein